jgi:hypothetical protein
MWNVWELWDATLGEGEKRHENFKMRFRPRWNMWEFWSATWDENRFENLEMQLTSRWNKAWEFQDEIYVKVKKRHENFEMWLKFKWNFEMQFTTLKCDLSQNERRHENPKSIKLWMTSFCEFIIFFISSPSELEGKDAVMKRNNSNDALSFF